MRDRAQIEMLPGEYRDAKAFERKRILDRLLADLKQARETGADWYVDALDFAQAFNRRPLIARGDLKDSRGQR